MVSELSKNSEIKRLASIDLPALYKSFNSSPTGLSVKQYQDNYHRRVFGNIMKYIKMSASSNFGNMFSMIGASALLPFLPMAPVQILLSNMLYDVS